MTEQEPAAEEVVQEAEAGEVGQEAEAPPAWDAYKAEETAGPVAAVEEGTLEEAEAEAPEAEEPAAEEQPVAEAEPVVEEPEAQEPAAAEAPEVEESATTGSIDQAEMRRRIEETRARLKAKAFDAMMSGESALLSRDSGEKPVPRGDALDVDSETESALDESLSQEEY